MKTKTNVKAGGRVIGCEGYTYMTQNLLAGR